MTPEQAMKPAGASGRARGGMARGAQLGLPLWRLAVLLLVLSLALPGRAAWADVPIGEDGLHKPDWLHATFKDMGDDFAEAQSQGKRLLVIWEQRGCIYCRKMHEEIFPRPEIDALLRNRYFVVQMNLFGDEEVTDFDGTVLPEKEMAAHWGVMFTPTMMFFDDQPPGEVPASQAAVAAMPGAFGPATTYNLLNWVLESGYRSGEHFQKYHARKLPEWREKYGH